MRKRSDMRPKLKYIKPDTLHSALEFLDNNGSETSVIAGGTDLCIKIRSGELKGRFVLDVSQILELKKVSASNGSINIGAGVTFTQLQHDVCINMHAPVISKAAASVGSVQIRNVGTLGGNVANASPAADSIPALLVHNPWVKIQSAESTRIEPLQNVVVGPYRTTLKSNELIVSFILEATPKEMNYEFIGIARRKTLSIARINAAVLGLLDSNRKISDIRICAGSITPAPGRQSEAEKYLMGKTPNLRTFLEAAELVSSDMIRKSGTRSSTEYKKPALEGLILKCLLEVFPHEC
jgi:CO/xanthine dehydrogenase FAD-binding subunit